MKTLEIIIKAYNRGILSRETRETAEELRREELVNVHGALRRALGVAESWLRGLRAVHYFLLRDGRVDSVRVQRTLNNATMSVTVNDGDDIGPVMYDIVHDFRAQHFPV